MQSKFGHRRATLLGYIVSRFVSGPMVSRLVVSRFGKTIAHYTVAALAAALALFARYLLNPLVHDHLPFGPSFLAVLLVAWYAGAGPANSDSDFVGARY
jgi:hypothetical protein